MKTYTYKEAADILGYTYEHIVALVQDNKLGRKLKPCYEITQDDIDNYERPKRGRPSINNSKKENHKWENHSLTAYQAAKLTRDEKKRKNH